VYNSGWQLRISCWTSVPLLSTIRRGGSKEGMVFSGMFLLDCSLENSAIAGRSFCLSIYSSSTFPRKYNLFTFKKFLFYNLHYFRDFTYRSDSWRCTENLYFGLLFIWHKVFFKPGSKLSRCLPQVFLPQSGRFKAYEPFYGTYPRIHTVCRPRCSHCYHWFCRIYLYRWSKTVWL
jgi:hypothetical protein